MLICRCLLVHVLEVCYDVLICSAFRRRELGQVELNDRGRYRTGKFDRSTLNTALKILKECSLSLLMEIPGTIKTNRYNWSYLSNGEQHFKGFQDFNMIKDWNRFICKFDRRTHFWW